ncbi:MAG: NapC/NirT family cytochrome c [Chloroflexi bacterium]|nr:NapC/NirT family cytochrome c [Chloroflexota bacterium]
MKKTKWFSSQYATIDLKDRRQRRRLRFFIIGGAVELLVLTLIGFRGVEYMDSPDFCGTVCHRVMEPQFTLYQRSPHARVACVQCHIGPGATWMVKSKINGIPQVFKAMTNTQERPIPTPVENLRPARDTCEQCHWPSKFSGDMVRFFRHFQEDEANTEVTRANVFKVGGGERGMARDIHWHIANDVWYLALDEKRQEIGWVGVEENNGNLKQFVDPSRRPQITPTRIEQEKRLMDCVDCHNRATHIFRSPAQLLDEALAAGAIDRAIPFIKKKGVEALTSSPGDIHGKIANVEALDAFYRTAYPYVYAEKTPQIRSAIMQVKEFARIVEFPDMKVDWKTHINNIGHIESPGCLRCHGKLVAESGPQQGKPISAVCQECHYPLQLPPAATPAAPAPAAPPEVARPVAPAVATSATPSAEIPPAVTKPTAPAATTPAPKPAGPPRIPAGHAPSGCALCHKDGIGGAPKFPSNHSAFNEATCAGCHTRS